MPPVPDADTQTFAFKADLASVSEGWKADALSTLAFGGLVVREQLGA